MELGDYIGTSGGKVTSIEDDIVVITEEYKPLKMNWLHDRLELTLRTSKQFRNVAKCRRRR